MFFFNSCDLIMYKHHQNNHTYSQLIKLPMSTKERKLKSLTRIMASIDFGKIAILISVQRKY